MRHTFILVTLLAASFSCGEGDEDLDADAVAKTKTGVIDPAVVRSAVPRRTVVSTADTLTGFTPQTRLGYTVGDQWEPAVAADRFGHVYSLYPQYGGVPGCPACPSPTMILQVSADGGASWSAPRLIAPPGSGQWDAQIVVDPADGRTVYAGWLQNNKSDTVVARSDDFGATWTPVVVSHTNSGTDKDLLAVRGPDVYVGYEHQTRVYISASHDGGATWTESSFSPSIKLGVSLAGGAAVDPAGNVFFSWAGYEQAGGAKGKVHLYVSRSTDRGASFTLKELDTSAAPPDCSAYLCGWAFLGAQITIASDAGSGVYALWNAGRVDGGPERVYFAASADRGVTWGAMKELSSAPAGAAHAFPALAAGPAGTVYASWMDARGGTLWNVYLRKSTDGGKTFGAETTLSTYVAGFDYIQPGGFAFPFGDYYELDLDNNGVLHALWGEGRNYDSPGSIWYAHGK
jgi:BNR repeat protein